MQKPLPRRLKDLEKRVSSDLHQIARIQEKIRVELLPYADGKVLKGYELVGWLGEIYGKLIFKGTLVSDEKEHDIEAGNMRISVKARKGTKSGWTQTGAIPRLDSEKGPTHLLFVHLDDNFGLLEAWLYEWNEIKKRSKNKFVRGEHRSYIFRVNPKGDDKFLVYRKKDQ